jgi:hypothetical protein
MAPRKWPRIWAVQMRYIEGVWAHLFHDLRLCAAMGKSIQWLLHSLFMAVSLMHVSLHFMILYPIVRLFTEIDWLYPFLGDIGDDGFTAYASGPPRTLHPIKCAIFESWDGWPLFHDPARLVAIAHSVSFRSVRSSQRQRTTNRKHCANILKGIPARTGQKLSVRCLLD